MYIAYPASTKSGKKGRNSIYSRIPLRTAADNIRPEPESGLAIMNVRVERRTITEAVPRPKEPENNDGATKGTAANLQEVIEETWTPIWPPILENLSSGTRYNKFDSAFRHWWTQSTGEKPMLS